METEAAVVENIRYTQTITVESGVQACEDYHKMYSIPKQLEIELPDIKHTSKEASVLSRDYSPLRAHHQKWAFSVESVRATPEGEVLHNPSIIKVIRMEKAEYFYAKSLAARARIKRCPHYKAALVEMWRLLNPFHLRALSKKIWLSFNAFLYTQHIKNTPTETALAWAKQDTDVDFKHKLGLEFQDFSTSVFEFLDSVAKSKLANEYTRLLKGIVEVISDQHWFKKADLHSKLHITQQERKGRPTLPPLKTPQAVQDFYLTNDVNSIKSQSLSISHGQSKTPTGHLRFVSYSPRLTDKIPTQIELLMPYNRPQLTPKGIAFHPIGTRKRREGAVSLPL